LSLIHAICKRLCGTHEVVGLIEDLLIRVNLTTALPALLQQPASLLQLLNRLSSLIFIPSRGRIPHGVCSVSQLLGALAQLPIIGVLT